MKKILYLFLIIAIGSIGFAQGEQEDQPQENTTQEEIVQEANDNQSSVQNSNQESEYITVVKNYQTFYYDKEGKLIASERAMNDRTFFYDKYGQLIGKSVQRNDKKYYYNGLNRFIGVCDENGCYDSNFASTGKIPPLPQINTFKPVINKELSYPKMLNK